MVKLPKLVEEAWRMSSSLELKLLRSKSKMWVSALRSLSFPISPKQRIPLIWSSLFWLFARSMIWGPREPWEGSFWTKIATHAAPFWVLRVIVVSNCLIVAPSTILAYAAELKNLKSWVRQDPWTSWLLQASMLLSKTCRWAVAVGTTRTRLVATLNASSIRWRSVSWMSSEIFFWI